MNRLNTFALAAALAGAAVLPAAAQQTTAPAPGPLRPFRVPTPEEFTLANGLRVVVVNQPALPIVNARVILKAGAVYEPAEKNGVANLTASLIDEGAAGMTGSQIAQQMERLGAQFNTGGGYASAFAQVTALKPALAEALELAGKTLMQPTFPAEEFQRVRTQAVAGYVQILSTVEGLADEAFSRAIFQSSAPYSRPSGGSRTTLEAITLQDVQEWHRRMYSPRNAILLLVGDINAAEARQVAQRALGAWTGPAVQLPAVSNPVQAVNGTRVILVDRPGSVQSGVYVGQAIPGYGDPDYFPLLVLSEVLGGGFKARINMNLRERRGWTYGAFTMFSPRSQVGQFAISTAVRTNATDSAVAEAVREYRRIAAEPVPGEELASTISNVTGSFPNSVQTVQGLAQRMETLLVYGLPLDFWSTYRERVAAVTPAEISRVGSSDITANAVTVVVAGDLSKIEAPIRALNLGAVEVWDADGNKVR
ncbi:MAG TPA: pitrilysin family protein [Longimicrobium sp.]|nr:pitrilysin family protein [Longimicrobium sp.]